MNFILDPRLAADTRPVARWPLCELRLMDDARYPWLILIPRIANARELIDLDAAARAELRKETDAAAYALRTAFAPDKLNIAALGNVVAQLHVHVIARFTGDDAWPKPVWGVHPPKPRDEAARAAFTDKLTPHLPAFAFEDTL
ncbi:HIT domain-containing protein [Lysobacter pythonis]|uniref:HIT domain-containing protein n=1 Tax=Solilutibacter pythonis TaxID=2483112 RepID=A0A3M2HYH6_9GAMM|nr:HIT family protein [Lysobacter pythonis]RMH94766.1 HIT domain-containing protein [Lysobacter pythonis]